MFTQHGKTLIVWTQELFKSPFHFLLIFLTENELTHSYLYLHFALDASSSIVVWRLTKIVSVTPRSFCNVTTTKYIQLSHTCWNGSKTLLWSVVELFNHCLEWIKAFQRLSNYLFKSALDFSQFLLPNWNGTRPFNMYQPLWSYLHKLPNKMAKWVHYTTLPPFRKKIFMPFSKERYENVWKKEKGICQHLDNLC